jgi:hypothetical protein
MGDGNLVNYPKTAGEQGKNISVVLTDSHCCPTSDGLDTA